MDPWNHDEQCRWIITFTADRSLHSIYQNMVGATLQFHSPAAAVAFFAVIVHRILVLNHKIG